MERPTLDKFPRRVLAAIDIQTAFIASRLVVAAERLQVFRALHRQSMTADRIGRKLGIHEFYLEPFLRSLVSMGLLRAVDGTYRNTRFAEKYFIKQRSIYWTRQFSKECADEYDALTVLEKALASGRRSEAIREAKQRNYLASMERDQREAEDFTQMLFHLHQGEAKALARYLDLSKQRALLDVGGGSGVASIAIARKYPHLNACILDIAPVCRIAAGNIEKAGLSSRICTRPGDIRRRLPRGFDVVLFCDIGEISHRHLRNAYECLPAGGLIVLADRYFSDDGTRPFDRLASFFAGSSFGLATHADIVSMLNDSGFRTIRERKVYKDMWIITGAKPHRDTR